MYCTCRFRKGVAETRPLQKTYLKVKHASEAHEELQRMKFVRF